MVEQSSRDWTRGKLAGALRYLGENYGIMDPSVRTGEKTYEDTARSFTGDLKADKWHEQMGLLDFSPVGMYFAAEEASEAIKKAEPNPFKRNLALLSALKYPLQTILDKPEVGFPAIEGTVGIAEAIPATKAMTKPAINLLKKLDLGALPKKTETKTIGALPTKKQNVENITVYHSSPKKIEGQFKESSQDVGIHFAKTPDLAHNAGVKSSLDTAESDAPIITEKFNLKVTADEIVEIDAKGGRFDFYDILEQLRIKNRISEDTFNKTFNELDNIEKKGIDPSEMMIQQNKIFNKNLSNEGIKVLKYLNEFDASPTFRELNNVKTEKEFNDLINNYKIKPDISYMVLDKNIIKKTETTQ